MKLPKTRGRPKSHQQSDFSDDSTVYSESPILLDIVSRLADMQKQIVLLKKHQDKSNMEIQSIKEDMANICSFLVPRINRSKDALHEITESIQGPSIRDAYQRNSGPYMPNQYWPQMLPNGRLYNDVNPFMMYGHPYGFPGPHFTADTRNKEDIPDTNFAFKTNISLPIQQQRPPASCFKPILPENHVAISSSEEFQAKQQSPNVEVPQQNQRETLLSPEQAVKERTDDFQSAHKRSYRPLYKSGTYSKRVPKKTNKRRSIYESSRKRSKLPGGSYNHEIETEDESNPEVSESNESAPELYPFDFDILEENPKMAEKKKSLIEKIDKGKDKAKHVEENFSNEECIEPGFASGSRLMDTQSKIRVTESVVKTPMEKKSGRQMLNSKATLANGGFFGLVSSNKTVTDRLESDTSRTYDAIVEKRATHQDLSLEELTEKEETKNNTPEITLFEEEISKGFLLPKDDFDKTESIKAEKENRSKGLWEMNPISQTITICVDKGRKKQTGQRPTKRTPRSIKVKRSTSVSSGISNLSDLDGSSDSSDDLFITETIKHKEINLEYPVEQNDSELELTVEEIQASESAFFNIDIPTTELLLKNKNLTPKQLAKLKFERELQKLGLTKQDIKKRPGYGKRCLRSEGLTELS